MLRPSSIGALVAALTVLSVPAAAGAALTVGVADNRGLDSIDGGASFVSALKDLGMKENRISVVWNPDSPSTIAGKARLDLLVANELAAGIRPVFTVYPARPTALAGVGAASAQFSTYVATLARAYPRVTDFIVGNEPNQPRFWQPQFSGTASIACSSFEPILASAYDSLKAVNPAITVVGVGLSPRGNDASGAASDASTSPVRCLHDLGAAYRASGRKKPIMDELAFHGYPAHDTQPFGAHYQWPNAGVTDLPRIKQAVWDAFHGTAQPTFAEAGRSSMLPALKLRVAEVGWQVGIVPSARGAYSGAENVPTTDETSQAADYTGAIKLLACDPSVKSLLFFLLEDESPLAGWQAGLLRADGSARPSYGAVKSELAAGHGACSGAPAAWRHSTTVAGASARFLKLRTFPAGPRTWSFAAGAKEDATFSAGLFRLSSGATGRRWTALAGRSLGGAKRGLRPVLSLNGSIKAPWGRTITFRRTSVKPGVYAFGIRFSAAMNPSRVTMLVSKPFRVTPTRR